MRSGFDLQLGALALPRGATIMMSAVTIRGMIDVAIARGLRVLPLDLDPTTLAPFDAADGDATLEPPPTL